jgi:hypothetical protein
MHHFARQPLELEFEEHDGFSEKLLKLFITYKPDGSYFIEVITFHRTEVHLMYFLHIST